MYFLNENIYIKIKMYFQKYSTPVKAVNFPSDIKAAAV